MRRLLPVVILCAILTTLNACGSPIPATKTATTSQPGAASAPLGSPSPSASPSPSPSAGASPSAPASPSASPSASASPSPSPTAPAAAASPLTCGYNWTNREGDPALVRQIQEALVAAGLTGAVTQVGEYGEGRFCSDSSITFLHLEYNFSVTLPVADLTDRQALGNQLGQVLTVLETFATKSQDRIAVQFIAGGAKEGVYTTKEAWGKARGLTGAALLDALQARR